VAFIGIDTTLVLFFAHITAGYSSFVSKQRYGIYTVSLHTPL
jgi:hypothetical protein